MADYNGPLLRGAEATKWMYENAIQGYDASPERAFRALGLTMGASPHMFSHGASALGDLQGCLKSITTMHIAYFLWWIK